MLLCPDLNYFAVTVDVGAQLALASTSFWQTRSGRDFAPGQGYLPRRPPWQYASS